MSILTSAEIIAYLGASSYTADIQFLHEGIERMIKNECDKNFESASYFELYDGKSGTYRLYLNKTPVTAVSRVSTSLESVIKVKNTLTDATTAKVVVDATNVTLTVTGGAGDSTTALAIATYSTLTLLVDAINAQSAKGWVTALYDSDYSAKKTAFLIAQQIDVTSWLVAEEYDYLYMGEPIDFILIDNSIEAWFPYGSQNIGVNYTAGSSPADIKMIVLTLVKNAYDRKTNDADGIKRFTVGDITTEYYSTLSAMPFIMDIIEKNRKMTI